MNKINEQIFSLLMVNYHIFSRKNIFGLFSSVHSFYSVKSNWILHVLRIFVVSNDLYMATVYKIV